ncbi:MAG: Lrp/AsnC ligand binding domain-containing protein [Thermodesulfobacteriota bacterium]|nr:Lrp/AsnC ligand binding domain-containing protein [Thermodesulfobacteriota bacterium]
MAVSAFVLIRTEADKTKGAFETLTKLKGVKMAHTVTGPFDIILLVEARTLHELGDMILSKIRGVDGISRTMTCVTVETG